MKYYIVPVNNGILDIDYRDLEEGIQLSVNQCYVKLREQAEERPSWQPIDQFQYLAAFGAGVVRVDKSIIKADSFDTATVTAEVHPDLTEITFYHADTGEVIATVPVDPATHAATLQVTATTPGVIRIRAGEPTVTKLNEVVITVEGS